MTDARSLKSELEATSADVAEPLISVDVLPADAWFELAHWAKVAQVLTAPQRRVAYALGSHVREHEKIGDSTKEAAQLILGEALNAGWQWTHTDPPSPRLKKRRRRTRSTWAPRSRIRRSEDDGWGVSSWRTSNLVRDYSAPDKETRKQRIEKAERQYGVTRDTRDDP